MLILKTVKNALLMYNIFTFLVFRMGRNSALIGARRTTNGQQWLDINLRFVLCYVMLCCVVLCCVMLCCAFRVSGLFPRISIWLSFTFSRLS